MNELYARKVVNTVFGVDEKLSFLSQLSWMKGDDREIRNASQKTKSLEQNSSYKCYQSMHHFSFYHIERTQFFFPLPSLNSTVAYAADVTISSHPTTQENDRWCWRLYTILSGHLLAHYFCASADFNQLLFKFSVLNLSDENELRNHIVFPMLSDFCVVEL